MAATVQNFGPISYQVMHNIDRDRWDGYKMGEHKLADGYIGETDHLVFELGTAQGQTPYTPMLEAIFCRHNRDDRPDGRDAPSLSVGDVIVIEPENGDMAWAYAVESVGFRPTYVTAEDRIGATYRALFIDR